MLLKMEGSSLSRGVVRAWNFGSRYRLFLYRLVLQPFVLFYKGSSPFDGLFAVVEDFVSWCEGLVCSEGYFG